MRTGEDIITQQYGLFSQHPLKTDAQFGLCEKASNVSNSASPRLNCSQLISGSNSSTTSSPPSTASPGSSAPSAPNQPTEAAAQQLSEGAVTQVSPTKATHQVSFCDVLACFFFLFHMATRHVFSGLPALGAIFTAPCI